MDEEAAPCITEDADCTDPLPVHVTSCWALPGSRGRRLLGAAAFTATAAFVVWAAFGRAALRDLPEEVEKAPAEVPHPTATGRLPAEWLQHLQLLEQSEANACEICDGICPALAKALEAYRVRPASEAPKELGLDLGFYKKYVNVMGIPVLSSDKVCDCVLQKAAWIVHGTTSHLQRMQETLEKMIQNGHRVAVMARSEKTTEVPEHSDLTPKDYWDGRARGLGATPYRPCSSGAEESVMCQPYQFNGYFGENILLHEFTHGIARVGFKFLDWEGQDWDDYNGAVYEASKKAGLWENTYAMTNSIEFFAEAVQSWYDTNQRIKACRTDPLHADGIHNCVNTRKELEAYDPKLYSHLAKVLKADAWRPGQGRSCGCASSEEVTLGFTKLDRDGNLDGTDPDLGVPVNPPHKPPGPEEPEEPVPAEPCLALSIPVICHGSRGCRWNVDANLCEADCAALQDNAACLLTGTCAWEDGTSRCHDCLPHDDSHIHCESWAASGECEKNPGWMNVNCKLSCADDGHRHCESWARRGECAKNPTYMLVHCQQSCSCEQLAG